MAFLPLPINVTESSHLPNLVLSFQDLCDWMKLGMFLGIPYPTFEKIELDKQGVDNHKMVVFQLWLSSCSVKKEILLTALSKLDHHW